MTKLHGFYCLSYSGIRSDSFDFDNIFQHPMNPVCNSPPKFR